MRRMILALILVVSAVAPARAQAPNTIVTIAGGGVNGTSPTAAYLPQPFSTVRDSNSNTYISVPGLNLVYKVDTTNTLTVFAGTGIGGFSGDGGPATQAELSFPQGLAVDKNNNLFIADSNNERIRRVDAATGNITTVAGSEDPFNGNFGGDNGPATNARLNFPTGVAVDGNGDLFITDTFNGAVRRVDGATQIITTIAGGGSNAGCSGGAGNTAGFADIIGIAVDGTGNVFVADAGLEIVCEISGTTGNVSTYAGTLGNPGTPGGANGDGGPATSAQMDQPNGLAVDSTGNLFITDSGNPKIRKVDTTANHTITTVAGIGFICGTGGISLTEPGCGDGGLATSATFDFPRGVFVDSSNKIIVTDTFNMRVRVIAAGTNPAITGFAGGGSGGDGAAATGAILGVAQTIAVDSNENVLALETNGERIRKIAAAAPNDITTVAGAGVGGATIGPVPLNGNGGPAASATFVKPVAIAQDSAGNSYIVDLGEEVVRVINNQASPITVATVTIQPGDIAIIAGNGQRCGTPGNPTKPLCGDNGSALSASLLSPQGVAVDNSGNIYISDAALNTVRVVNNSTGTISTFAGTPGQACTTYPTNCGDFGAPTSALLNIPIGLATFVQGSAPVLYIADVGDNVIREVNQNQNAIFPVMFNGLPTFGGDGGEGATASMEQPAQIAVDDQGNIFVGGGSDNVVRRMDANAQTIITVAGDVDNLGGGFSGDGGPSTLAQMENFGLAVFKTAQGTHDLFIADSGSNRIRKVNLQPVISNIFPANGATLAFAPTLIGQTSDQQFISLSNSGLDDLILSNIQNSNPDFTVLNCSQSGAPGVGCFLVVLFSPTGSPGAQTGTLTFTTNDPANPSFTYHFTGTASNTPASLSVTLNPAAGGFVASDPSGINCSSSPSSTCGPVNFPANSTVTLSALPFSGFAFSGWNTGNAPGANCPGTAACQVPMPASGGVTVVANFSAAPPPPTFTVTITPLGNGTGTVTEPATGINCTITNNTVSGACTATVAQGTQLTFTGTATGTSSFAGWLTPCNGTAPCKESVFFNQNVTPVFSAQAQPFAKGQVFLSTNGMVFILDPSSGNIVDVLGEAALATLGHGMTFDSVGNLFIANDNGTILEFSKQAAGPTLFGNGNCPCDNRAHSVVIDPFGNVIVGEDFILGSQQPTLLQFAGGAGPSGTPSGTFFPAYDNFSSPAVWTEVLDSSDTVAYTEGSQTVKVFDLDEQVQHPDIAANLHGALALRELPDGTILVADTDRIARVNQSGSVTQTYTVPGVSAFFQNLNLDPDGVTFWTNDELTGIVYRINISSGAVANGSGFTTGLGFASLLGTQGIGGIAVFGQPASGGADLAVTMTGPATITAGGTATYTIVATNNGPLAAAGVTMSAFIQNGASTITNFSPPAGVSCQNIVNIGTNDDTRLCTIGAMASGASDTFTVSVQPTGTVTNTATMADSSPADPNATNNFASVTTTITAPTLVSIAVTPNPASVAAGGTQQFTATGTFSDNSTQNLTSTATWSSSNTAIATISAAGLASGVKAGGPVTITATSGTVSGTAQLTVTAPTLVSIAVTPNPASVVAGGTQQFTATGTFSDNSTQNLTSTATWSSSNTAIATINAAGLASGVTAGGPVTIKAAQSGINGTAALTVTAAPPPTFTLTVATQGTGNGTVTSQAGLAPAINCTTGSGTGCTATYNSGQSVVLTATPLTTNNSTFAGWSGACTNLTGTCSVTMNQAQSVTATFNLPGATPTFTSTTLPNGAVGVRYGADIQVTGGTQPYTFALTNGSSLPAGFTLVATSSGNVAAGHIFNDNPAATGTFTFGITVTDSSSPTPQTTTATISLTIATAPANIQASLLRGPYAALFRGTDSGGTFAQGNVASFNFDGKGNFTVLFDGNSEDSGLQTQCTASGTYSVGEDNRGLITITTNGTCVTGTSGGGGGVFAFALGDVKNGVASTARFINFVDDDGSGGLGAAILRRQDPTAFTSASLAGTYVAGLTGQDSSLGRAVEVSLATFDNKLGITSGSFDLNDNGTLSAGTLSGSYTAPDANGRSVLTLTILGGPSPLTTKSVIYIVSANEVFFLTLDPTTTNLLLAGDGQRQFNPNSFGLGSLAGPDVLSFRGTSSGGTSAGVGVLTATVVNNVGNFSIAADSNDGGNLKLGQVLNGTYTMASNGRGVVTGQSGTGNVNLITYLIRPDRAFFIGEDSSDPPFGEVEPQVGAPFSASPFANNLFVGEDELVPNGHNDISGVALLAPSSVLNATIDQSHSGGDLTFGQLLSFGYTVDSTGHFTVAQTGPTGNLTGYVVSPFKVIFFDTSNEQGTSSRPQLIIAQSIPQPPGVPSPAATTVNFATPVAVGNSAQSAPVTFTNAGVGPLTLQTLTNAADFSAAGTCVNFLPVVLAPGQSCQVVINFAPTASTTLNTPLSETITIATDAGNITITATGTAIGPGVTITPSTTVNFGNQPVGTTSSAIVTTVTNSGNSALVIGNVALTGANTADFSLLNPAGACQGDSSVSPGLSCTINVTFTPASATTFNAAVTLTDNATGSPQTITLTGTGTAAGSVITITPSATVNFGNQLVGTTSGAITTTVTNTGTQAITLTNVTLSPLPNGPAGTNSDGFTIVAGTGTCTNGTNLAANGGKCVLPVTFGPTATGAVSSTITLNDSAGSQVITLNGTGTAPTISLNPTSLSFSTAPDTTSAAQTVTVTNSGAAPLHIANVLLGGEDPGDFAFVNGTTPCGKGVTVQPQAACTIGVDFTAPSQATFTATVTVTSDASNGVQTIPLTGTGVVISIAPPPGGSTTATTNPGGTAVFPLVLSSTGLTGNATLTCTSPSTPTITCNVVPGTVPLTPNGITHAAIVVNTFCQGTAPASGSVPGNPTRNLPPAPWLIAIVGLALLASMALTKKRTLRLAMPLAVLMLMGIFASSCGSPPKGPAGITPPGVYPLVITATVGQASSSITLTLTVN